MTLILKGRRSNRKIKRITEGWSSLIFEIIKFLVISVYINNYFSLKNKKFEFHS